MIDLSRQKYRHLSGEILILDEVTLPREAVRMTSGVSEEVAIAVTQPEWPVREPRKRRDSAIVVSCCSRRRVQLSCPLPARILSVLARNVYVTVTATVTLTV